MSSDREKGMATPCHITFSCCTEHSRAMTRSVPMLCSVPPQGRITSALDSMKLCRLNFSCQASIIYFLSHRTDCHTDRHTSITGKTDSCNLCWHTSTNMRGTFLAWKGCMFSLTRSRPTAGIRYNGAAADSFALLKTRLPIFLQKVANTTCAEHHLGRSYPSLPMGKYPGRLPIEPNTQT